MDFVMSGVARNHVNTLVLVNESRDTPEPRIADFVLQKHYASTRHDKAWSDATFWYRSWPTRTMFLRPDILVYSRE